MAAKEKWLAGDLDSARAILQSAFAANEDKESLWLAAWKLEFENGELKRAQVLLQRARDRPNSSTPRVWMKSAIVEREIGNVQGKDPYIFFFSELMCHAQQHIILDKHLQSLASQSYTVKQQLYYDSIKNSELETTRHVFRPASVSLSMHTAVLCWLLCRSPVRLRILQAGSLQCCHMGW